MATIVNNPPAETSGGGAGWVVGALILLLAVVLFFMYGLPALNRATTTPEVNIPSEIDVNVSNPAQQ